MTFATRQLDHFHKAAVSLKLFSRAELNDEKNRTLIEKLYVDPLPNDHVFKTLLADNTTLIVGRKGTGKSTVFQRVQHEIRKNRSNVISAYMDIRNVFEASQIDPVTVEKIDALESAMASNQVQKFLLYKRFFQTLITDVRDELKGQVEQSFLSRLKDRVSGTSAEVFSGLDAIIEKLNKPDYENIAGIIAKQVHSKSIQQESDKVSATAASKISPTKIEGEASIAAESVLASERGDEEIYTQLLMRVIGINDVISELKQILNSLGIKSLYLFLDDFSELPREAMHLLVDALISPLARWSDFIKFKIAAYPGRVYLGSLDTTKIEEIHLDMYGLYGSAGVAKMEEKATDFVRRLIEKRIQHFCKCDASMYFNMRSTDLWRTLFYASMANPRILGHLMLYAYDSHLIYGNSIGVQSVQDASQRYYEDKISPFFNTGKYRLVFEERSSIYSLKELLERIVARARAIRQEGSRHTSVSKSRPFSSHFYVSHEYDDLLQSLELSFFVTKYFEQSDRAGVRVSIYALNYGLCTKYQIGFGRPSDKREDRLYFVDRQFDYNAIARAYMQENQEVKCDNCAAEFDLSMLPALKMLHMRCPTCNQGHCKVVNLSRKYGDVIEAIGPELLLPDAELGIMQTLFHEDKPMVAAEIAGELDCSGQLVGRRGKHLAERNLVDRSAYGQVYRYRLTSQAKAAYFSDAGASELDIPNGD
ncbi:hypothetical protein [Blastomonas fulva]|uniref:hypothetical protein n=1 Tax=Blastomonas fulva TaxID=1550728 RepID=UPI0025A31F08|nr:hypothetical protein [Blastomonas fulva]MDM7927058.1 hypothetical protein [Blastomonas fulva]MDM7966948.1 hypothetical protein [Blastomonas fulva]